MNKTLLLLLISSTVSFSQAISFDGKASRNDYLNYGSLVKDKELSKPYYESIKGSPFKSNEFLPVRVNSYDVTAEGRYDEFKDRFEIKTKRKRMFYLKKILGNTITFLTENEKYIVLNDKENKFFKIEEGEEEKALLVSRKTKKLMGGTEPKTSYEDYVKPYFKYKEIKYYITFDERNVIKIPRSKKKFTKIFNNKEDLIRDYISTNKLSHKNIEDLKKIVKFYNSKT